MHSARAGVRLDTLHGLRGVLSLIVFLFHAAATFVLGPDLSVAVMALVVGPGQACLGFFFMLSGFILVWVARPGETRAAFWRRRAAKVLPNHLVTWAVGVGLALVVGTWDAPLWHLLPSLALLHVWVPVEHVLLNVNGPNWSLAAEAFFYALFPAMYAVLRRIPDDRLWRWVQATVAWIAGWALLLVTLLPDTPTWQGVVSMPRFYFMIWFPLSRLPEFFLGMLLCRLVTSGQWTRVGPRVWLPLLVLPWSVSLLLPRPLGWVATFVPLMIIMLCNAATADIAGRRSWLTHPWTVWLGSVSFGMYLVHVLVLEYAHLAIGGGAQPVVVAVPFVLACLVVSLGLAHLLHTWVELPAMRRFGRSTRRFSSVNAPVGPASPTAGTLTRDCRLRTTRGGS